MSSPVQERRAGISRFGVVDIFEQGKVGSMSNQSDIRCAARRSHALVTWVGRIGVVMLALGLCASAWAQEGHVIVRDRSDQFPPEGPVQVSLVIPQTTLEMEGFNSSTAFAMAGLVGAALGHANQARWNRRYEQQILALAAPIEALDVQALMVEALQRYLPDAITLTEEGILVDQAPFTGSGDARHGAQHLHLMLDYYLLTSYNTVRMSLSALAPLEPGNRSRLQHYRQRIIFDITPPQSKRRTFSTPAGRVAQWDSASPEYMRDQFVAGIDQLARMLAYDIPASPPRVNSRGVLDIELDAGRRMVTDHGLSLYGGVLKVEDGREWVRHRRGLLWNTPVE